MAIKTQLRPSRAKTEWMLAAITTDDTAPKLRAGPWHAIAQQFIFGMSNFRANLREPRPGARCNIERLASSCASWRPTVDYTERTELVRSGLFAVIRNPIFTFIIVTAAAMALMTPNVVALAGVVGLWLGIEIHVRRVEEPYLRWAHGDAYRDYTATVGRFIPGIGRSRDRRT